MEPGKHKNSDTSSSENDNQLEKNNNENAGVGRSYECTFCKRGFTNAQALGGHMNIHRKDKAKAKQRNQEEPSIKNIVQNEDYMNSRYFNQILSVDQQQRTYHRSPVETQMNFQVYLPSSNPSLHTDNIMCNSPFWRQENMEVNRDETLNLRIGLAPVVEEGSGNEKEENDQVDLELRLGHDP